MRARSMGLIASGLLVTGCTRAEEPAPLTSGEEFSVVSALAELPATEDDSVLLVQAGDLKTATEV